MNDRPGAPARRTTRAPSRTQWLGILGIVGIAGPVLAYFALVSLDGVNVLVFDQWSDVSLIGRAFSGHLSASDLWAQHNQNRIVFPNLIVLFLAYSTHLNVRIEEYVSALLLVGSEVLVIAAHRLRSPSTPLIWYCPVAILMLSWVQYENALWGFQLAWYVVMICLAGSLFVLDRPKMTYALLAVGAGIAIVGSYSSIQGLFIWPAGLLLLLYRRRHWKVLLAWTGAGVATVGLYFYHLQFSQFPRYQINPLLHPLFALKLFFFSLGNVAGKPVAVPLFPVATPKHFFLGPGSPWIVALGVAVFATALLAVVSTGWRDTRQGAEPIGVSLILVALGFAVFTVIGRGLHGYAGVSASRYTTFTILALVGSYLVVIPRPVRNGSEPTRGVRRGRFSLGTTWPQLSSGTSPVGTRIALAILITACVTIQTLFGNINGISGARQDRLQQLQATTILRAYGPKDADGGKLPGHLSVTDYAIIFTGFKTQLIPVAKQDKLSLFDTN